jgi:ribosomal-protein-alanine N-acetyltransferase
MHEGEWLVRTERLGLRFPGEPDRAEYVRVFELSREQNKPWFPSITPVKTADQMFEEGLERSERGRREDMEYRLLGILGDGRIAAFVNLSNVVRRAFQCATIGWSVNAELARQGYCTETVAAALDFAFASPPTGIGLHRVQAAIIPQNVASIRVAEKTGFVPEGLCRRYLQIAGRWQDHALYAKLADEHTARYLNRTLAESAGG